MNDDGNLKHLTIKKRAMTSKREFCMDACSIMIQFLLSIAQTKFCTIA